MLNFTARLFRFILKRTLRVYKKICVSVNTIYSDTYIGDPTSTNLVDIQQRLEELNIQCEDIYVDIQEYNQFKQFAKFPADYHGGFTNPVYEEKILEHFYAWYLLGAKEFETPYVDVAAASSPWVKILDENGIKDVFAIDLFVHNSFKNLDFYQLQDATKTTFNDNSISSISMQCAFENFVGNSDIELLKEFGRILKVGGKVVILPLYIHTHACFWQSAEYYGKVLGNLDEKRYVRKDMDYVSFARFNSPENINERIFKIANENRLKPSIKVLRNKDLISSDVYLHFILILEKF